MKDKGDFEFNDIDFFAETEEKNIERLQSQSQQLVKDSKIFRRFLERQYNRVSSFEQLTKLPEDNEQIRIITQKSFNGYAILLYLTERVNIQECYLTTYSIDKNTIRGIEILAKTGNITNITLLVSDYINYRMPQRARELKTIANKYKNIKLIFAWNHTKIICAKTSQGYYVVEGSGNLSDNARIEQYLFEKCQETYEFHKGWIEDVRDSGFKEVNSHG